MASEVLELLSDVRCFGGRQLRYRHRSSVLHCAMNFSIYFPPQASMPTEQPQPKIPLLMWLSGLTCTDENFVTKAGAQRLAAELGIAVLALDTSPRGEGVPDAPDGAYDLGLGAGFYVNATQAPWAQHYRMYDYVVDEMPALLAAHFPQLAVDRTALAGHSMGGHGALMIALRNPGKYRSASAFAPICAPMQSPWGEQAFSQYLGLDQAIWQDYDASLLLAASVQKLPLLVDQGEADNFLATQLMPEKLVAAAPHDYPLTLRRHAGYDHSYFFIASFIDDHLRFHHRHLQA